MSAVPSMRQPVRVSELLGIPKSTDKKPTSERKRLEPVKVKDLLASCSKIVPSSEERASRKTFVIPKSAKKPVRRALYSKLTSPGQSPRRNNAESSAVKVLAKKSPRKSRKSFLAPPNSIAQRHIQQVINENTQYPTIMEERYSQIHEQSQVIHERPTVIKNATSRHSYYKSEMIIENKPMTIPIITVDEDVEIKTVNNNIDISLVDKENIPPPVDETTKPLAENKGQLFENVDLHLVGLYRSAITRMEKLDHDMETVKAQQAVEIALLKQIYNLMTNKIKVPVIPISVADVSSSPQILIERKSPSNVQQVGKENVLSEKKKKRKSREIVLERRRSARLAARLSGETNDSFTALENELNVNKKKLTPKQSPAIKTPKNTEQPLRAKSDRPLREYLAMKASMSFLETPEPNGFRRNVDLINSDTPLRNQNARKSISSKLYDELQDLYLDSPESGPSCQ